MRDIPLEVVLSFPLPNYTHPQTRGEALIIVNAIFISLVVIAVSLRFYTRIFIKRWLGSDDYLIGLSLVRNTYESIVSFLHCAASCQAPTYP